MPRKCSGNGVPRWSPRAMNGGPPPTRPSQQFHGRQPSTMAGLSSTSRFGLLRTCFPRSHRRRCTPVGTVTVTLRELTHATKQVASTHARVSHTHTLPPRHTHMLTRSHTRTHTLIHPSPLHSLPPSHFPPSPPLPSPPLLHIVLGCNGWTHRHCQLAGC